MARLLKADIEALKELHEEGFTFLARDENGRLYAYTDENIGDIEKADDMWSCDEDYERIDDNSFKFIKWEDEKPTSIEELMKEVK